VRRRHGVGLGLAAAVAVGLAAAAVLMRGGESEVMLPAPRAVAERAVVATDFAGAAECADCHRGQYEAWRASTHGRAGGLPGADLLIARFDGRPIRFRDAVVLPQRNGAGDYVFTIVRDGAPGSVLRVDGVIGGGHMVGGGTQGFVTRHDDGTWRFLPFDWSRDRGGWFCNTGTRTEQGWQPITPEMRLADCGDWPPVRALGVEPRLSNCQQCHGSRIDLRLAGDGSGYRTEIGSLAIDCESCHGPGAAHVALARAGDIAEADDPLIAVLGALDTDASLAVCFQCHALKDALSTGYLPGLDPDRYFSVALPLLGDAALHGDGRVRTFAYQETHLFSECYRNGSMTCVDCHDPHASTYRDAWSRPVASRFDDAQCTACHASKLVDPVAHTRHPAGSPGSLCVSCHMPYLQHPEVGDSIPFARSDHTIPVPRPAHEAALGVRTACALCHADWSTDELERRIRDGWGEIRPLHPAVAALSRAGGVSERADLERAVRTGDGHAAAQFMALARLFERHMRLDRAEGAALDAELRRLTEDPDVDMAALALAALHLTRGRDTAVRRFLATALDSRGADEHALRLRWSAALAYRADVLRATGDAAGAEQVLRRAVEVAPGDARLPARIGLTLVDRGRFADAVREYRLSLERDGRQPLTLVNLGIALNALGDAAGAADAYRRAIALNAAEPLAHYNLGNVYLRAGDAERALPLYQRAAQLDPANSAAHFNMARALLLLGDAAGAVAALDAGLEFAPDDAAALRMRAQLR
jgi:tetratricopeptide (TPR) repeat protein